MSRSPAAGNDEHSDEPTPRGAFRLMLDPVAGPFFGGRILSMFGAMLFSISAAMTAFKVTGSAFDVGLVTLAHYVPQLLLGPWCGTLADRGDARIQIIAGRLIVALGSGVLATWIWLVGGEHQLPGAGPLLICSVVVGLGFVLGGPATHSMVAQITRPGEMATATGLNSVVPMTLGRAAAPAVAGLVILHLGSAAAFAAACVLNVAYAALIAALRLPRKTTTASSHGRGLRAAVRHMHTDPRLALLLLGITAVGIGQDPSISLAPPLAAELGRGADLAGWIGSSHGVGVGLGLLAFPVVRRCVGMERAGSQGLTLVALGLLGVAATQQQGIVLVSMCVSGIGMTLAFTSITTQVQERVPDQLRGRIMSLWFIGFLGARPFASLMNGVIADALSVRWALMATSGLVLVAAYVCRPAHVVGSTRQTPGTE